MEGPRIRNPAPRPVERSSLFGLVTFRPRTAIVLAALTLTVGIVALHFSRQSELKRTDDLVQEGMRLFAAAQREGGSGASRNPAEVEERVRALTGAKIVLPRDERLFSFLGVTRGTAGKSPAAAIRLTYEGDLFLLLVVGRKVLGRGESPEELFPGADFVSGETDGRSFVFWERDGAAFFLVSGVDLTRAFDLVRRHFT